MAESGSGAESGERRAESGKRKAETMTHLNEDDLALHYYGEMDAGEEAHAGAHLADCARCRASYATLQRILAAVDADVVPEPREGFERTVWARLQPNLDSRGWWASGRTGTRPWFAWLPMQVGWAAAVAVLVIGAFFAGRGWQRDSMPGSAAAGAAMRERVLLVDLGEHLDRSQAMLVELVSAGGSRRRGHLVRARPRRAARGVEPALSTGRRSEW